MAQSTEGLNVKIKSVRKSMLMSLHDCAKILGTSTNRYLAFEQGKESLSLPELEILACYFGMPLMECLEGPLISSMRFTLLAEDKRKTYINLREKWIRSRIAMEIESEDVKLEELTELLEISPEKMDAYRKGEIPIPFNHLLTISSYLNITLDDFFPELELGKLKDIQIFSQATGQWNPEFPNEEGAHKDNEVSYNQLLAALKEIPEEDQAQVAKALLNKLRSI